MVLDRRLIVDRPAYTRRSFATPNSTITPTPVAHPSTRGVCVGGGDERLSRTHASAHAREAPSVEELLESVALLTPQLQKQFLDRAAAQLLLTASADRADRDVSMWSVAVYSAFCEAVGGPAAAGVGPQVLRRLLGAASAWAPVEQFMATARLSELPVADRQAVYNMLADLLVQHARGISRRTKAPFSAKLLSTTVVNIAGLFDTAFPGYLEAGLAHVVARRHRSLQAA